jgi:hypothetical protein
VQAAARDNAYVIDANVSFGIAGVGGAAGVAVVSNETLAGVEAGATINATGGIAVGAIQNTAVDIYTVAGSAGAAAFSGAFSIGVIDNTTRAYVEDGSSAATAATLDAGGRTEIAANSSESITTATVSAAGGGVGVAGAVGVKVVTSETTAAIGDYTKVNQTTRGGAAQDVAVSATDAVHLAGGGGSAAIGAGFGAGATAEVNVVRNTTTASIGDSARVRADGDIGVAAASTKDVQAAALALGGGGSVGIAGAVSLAFVGTSIASDSDAQSGIGDGATASSADSTMKKDGVSGQLGSSEHVQGAKSEIGTRSATLGVASDLNDTTTSSQDKTRAYIGSQATIVAGDSVGVTASDQTQINLHAVGAAGGFVGIGGAIGVGITNSTTEAFIDASTTVNATGVVTVAATAGNIGAGGYSNVLSAAGAGGVVGLSAAVAVLDDASTTRAYLGNSVDVQDATLLTISANTDREARTETIGVSVGGLAVGASVSLASFTGTTTAYFGNSVKASVDDLALSAGDDSTAVAKATAGAAGILSGSGADASATLDSKVSAYTGNDADIVANNDVGITATSTASADAQAIGVSAGAAAVGVSLSSATLTSTVLAALGDSGDGHRQASEHHRPPGTAGRRRRRQRLQQRIERRPDRHQRHVQRGDFRRLDDEFDRRQQQCHWQPRAARRDRQPTGGGSLRAGRRLVGPGRQRRRRRVRLDHPRDPRRQRQHRRQHQHRLDQRQGARHRYEHRLGAGRRRRHRRRIGGQCDDLGAQRYACRNRHIDLRRGIGDLRHGGRFVHADRRSTTASTTPGSTARRPRSRARAAR